MLGFLDSVWPSEVLQSTEVLRSMDHEERDKGACDLATFPEASWEREAGEDMPLTRRGRVFKLSIVSVAKSDKVIHGGDLYAWSVETALAVGIKTVYVTGIKCDYGSMGEAIESVKRILPEKLVWIRTYRSQRRLKKPQDARMSFLRY